jgi:hypothetical protein
MREKLFQRTGSSHRSARRPRADCVNTWRITVPGVSCSLRLRWVIIYFPVDVLQVKSCAVTAHTSAQTLHVAPVGVHRQRKWAFTNRADKSYRIVELAVPVELHEDIGEGVSRIVVRYLRNDVHDADPLYRDLVVPAGRAEVVGFRCSHKIRGSLP